VIGALLRIYSYLYHAALSILLIGLSLVAMESRSHTLKLDMLPWKGKPLTYWLLGAGLCGLFSVLLAATGRLRALFLLYAVAMFGLMVRGYFLTGYGFSGKDEFRFAVWLTAGALLAIVGAASQFTRKKPGKRR
jgi:uncharacterized membrane protein YdcZ (DUF606 family)